jgi:hypothetical protein
MRCARVYFMRATVAAAIAGLLAASSIAAGQGLPALQDGTTVRVTTADEREHEGSIASISPSAVVLRMDAESRSFPSWNVRRIEGRDSLSNGIRNGGIAGAAALGGFAVYLSHALCEKPDGCVKNDLRPIGMLAGLGGGIGMAVGAVIDHAIKGRRVLYVPSRSLVVDVAPHLATNALGARVSVTWGE